MLHKLNQHSACTFAATYEECCLSQVRVALYARFNLLQLLHPTAVAALLMPHAQLMVHSAANACPPALWQLLCSVSPADRLLRQLLEAAVNCVPLRLQLAQQGVAATIQPATDTVTIWSLQLWQQLQQQDISLKRREVLKTTCAIRAGGMAVYMISNNCYAC